MARCEFELTRDLQGSEPPEQAGEAVRCPTDHSAARHDSEIVCCHQPETTLVEGLPKSLVLSGLDGGHPTNDAVGMSAEPEIRPVHVRMSGAGSETRNMGVIETSRARRVLPPGVDANRAGDAVESPRSPPQLSQWVEGGGSMRVRMRFPFARDARSDGMGRSKGSQLNGWIESPNALRWRLGHLSGCAIAG